MLYHEGGCGKISSAEHPGPFDFAATADDDWAVVRLFLPALNLKGHAHEVLGF